MRVQKIGVKESVGRILSHDLTKIVPGEFKGVAFKKGHCITPEDVPELLKMEGHHLCPGTGCGRRPRG